MSQTNAKWLSSYKAAIPSACLREYDPKHAIVVAKGSGPKVWDVEGNCYFDFTCGYSTTNFGHSHPDIIAAAAEQLDTLDHLTGQPHAAMVTLADRLIKIFAEQDKRYQLPATHRKVVFNSTGARAIETAWKAAQRYRPGRLLSLSPSFHGNTIATAVHSTMDSVPEFAASEFSSKSFQTDRRPSSEYPYCARCPLGLQPATCQLDCANSLFKHIEKNATSTSAILLEPMLGARGYIAPPATYFQRLASIAKAHGILLIADEIQTGLGRCGDWTMSHTQAWQADLTVIGKSLGGGVAPISAAIGSASVLDCLQTGDVSETFAATPLATAVAHRVLDLVESQGTANRALEVGKSLRDQAQAFFQQAAPARNIIIEGVGASCCIEFLESSLAASVNLARQFAIACQTSGLLVHLSGPHRTRVVLLPPLNIKDSELEDAISRLKVAFEIWNSTSADEADALQHLDSKKL